MIIDNWLRNIKDVQFAHQDKFDALNGYEDKLDLLCELNIMSQVANVCRTTILQNAWARGQTVEVHGWIYRLQDGLLRDLNCSASRAEHIPEMYRIISKHVDIDS